MTQLDLPENLEEIGRDAFGRCTRLTEITIPKGVEELEQFVLEDCKKLKVIEVPEHAVIDDRAFQGCPRLTVIKY